MSCEDTRLKTLFAIAIVLLTGLVGMKCKEADFPDLALSRLIEAKKIMVDQMVSMKSNVDHADSLKKFIDTLEVLKQSTVTFMESPLDRLMNPQSLVTLKKTIDRDEFKYTALNDPLIRSFTLSHNNEKRTWLLLRVIRDMKDFDRSSVCKRVQNHKHADPRQLSDLKSISITNICNDVNSCPVSYTLYSYKKYQTQRDRRDDVLSLMRKKWQAAQEKIRQFFKYWEEIVFGACDANKKCNIRNALPYMAGVLKFQINEMIFQKICPDNCEDGKCDPDKMYKQTVEDINRMIGFSGFLPSFWRNTWKTFYTNAMNARAFTNLEVALSMIEEKKDIFLIASYQCYLLKFTPSCGSAEVYQQFKLFKKMQDNKQNRAKVKDLQLYSRMDHSKMIDLLREDLQHMSIMGGIRKLDDNLKASIAGISEYFQGLAQFDIGIAKNDILFLQGELDKYEKSLSKVQTKLNKDVTEGMKLMIGVVSANLAEEIGKLAALIATNSNPLKLIFSGPDVSDILDRSGAVANAATDVVRGTALFIAVTKLAQDSMKLPKAFGENTKQITSLTRVVDKIRSGQGDNIGDDATLFVEEYGNYSPQTDRSSLAKNDALWSAFTGSMCDLLNGDVGIAGSIPKSIAGGKLLCERLEGTLAQFFTLREDIFDFQFQLVDQLALIIRGYTAKRFASNIKPKHGDTLDASQFLSGFFLMQHKILTIASVFCDVMEYKQLGTPINPCITADGLFRQHNIRKLIAYSKQTPHDEIVRNVYIPTRTNTKGDTAVIDLQALARGEKVIFKIPGDVSWLQKHRWMLIGETAVPFLKSLKVFLPPQKNSSEAVHGLFTTQITVTSIAGSKVSTINPNTGVTYMLPKFLNTYRTIYDEGLYSSCSTQIENPYNLCDNLPRICDRTRRRPGQVLLPTILSTFSLEVAIQKGGESVEYDAPRPATALLVRAKVSRDRYQTH